MTKKLDYTPVSEFYARKSIFVTGGTGFIGMVLIEKLLYSCPDINKIYMMVRQKRSLSAAERMKKFLDCPVFDRLKEENPENLKKIIPVNGDLSKPALGIEAKVLQTIRDEVTIVFHLAATVKFNEPLSVAVKINVEGTEEILKLCHSLKYIEVFIYMSTIFSNTDDKINCIEEKLYPSPKSLVEVYNMINENDPKEVFSPEALGKNDFLPGYLRDHGRPNTYTFTKALAENVVAKKRGSIPTVMIRPSVVTPANDEPIKGWAANWMGPTSILVLLSKGYVRCQYGESDYTLEIIPVDYVVNLTIVSAAKYDKSTEIPIYHSCTSSLNPITLRETATHFTKESCKQKFQNIPYPWIVFSRSSWILTFISFFLQLLPAYIADLYLYLCGYPTSYVKMLKKYERCHTALKYFSSKTWFMPASRSQELIATLDDEDRRKFQCDPLTINWENYMATYFNGVKRYLLKL